VQSIIIVPERNERTQNKGERLLVILACAAMLYFAVGGALPHEHSDGHENACHVCQALHMPALATAILDFAAAPVVDTRYTAPVQNVLPNHDFSLLRAGRAPPTI
jgi:hypothetical protein